MVENKKVWFELGGNQRELGVVEYSANNVLNCVYPECKMPSVHKAYQRKS